MSTHTPGPWTWHHNMTTLSGSGFREQVLSLDLPEFVDDANKRLIAAAPDLLDMVRELVEHRGCTDPDCCALAREQDRTVKKAQALLARIDGEV